MNVRSWLKGVGIALVTCTGIAGTASAQAPANDLCANAIDISAGPFPLVSGNLNIGLATNDTITAALPSGLLRPECESSSSTAGVLNRAVWWKVTTGASNSRLTLTETSTTDVLMTVYKASDGTCGTLAYQFCVDTSETAIPFNLEANTTYYVATSRWGTTVPTDPTNVNMTFDLVAATAAPTNNTCATAFAITGSTGSDARDIGGAINSLPPATCQTFGVSSSGGSTYFPIWYSYTTGATPEAFAFTENSTEDVIVTFFTGTCGSLTQVTCLDGGSGTTETGSLLLNASTSYLIRVSRKSQAAAVALSVPINFGWSITTPPAAPSNATCATATVIGSVPFVSGPIAIGGSPADTTINPTCDSSSNVGAANPIWFAFTPATTGVYQFLETTTNDTVYSIWTGACGGGQTQVVCDDANVDGTNGHLQVLTGGTQYFINVARFSASVGTFADSFNLSVNAIAAPANDTCATAQVVTAPTALASATVDARGALPDQGLACNTTGFTTSTTAGIWYRVDVPAGEDYVVTYTETATTDAIWGVFTGTCGSLTAVNCTQTDSANTFIMTAGNSYYLLLGVQGTNTQPTSATTFTRAITFAAATSACCTASACTVISKVACSTAGGTWRGPLSVTCSVATNLANACQAAPANDLCANATAISGALPQTFTTATPAAATDDIDSSCNSATNPSAAVSRWGVWYTYTTGPDFGTFNYSETGTNDIVVGVFTGTCAGLTQIACNDSETSIAVPMSPSTTYYFLLSTFSNTLTPASSYVFVANSFTPVTGACCNITSCTTTTLSACPGLWLGANTSCNPIPTIFESFSTPLTIPDAVEGTTPVVGTLTRTLTSTDPSTISTVVVRVNMAHGFVGDVRAKLTGPNGTTVTLFNRPTTTTLACIADFTGTGGSANDLAGIYTFDDTAATGFGTAAIANAILPAGAYRAQECDGTLVSLNTAFAGISATGNWTLELTDRDAVLSGTLTDWGIIVNGVAVTGCSNAGSCCVGATCSVVVNAAACSGTFTAGGSCSPVNPCTPANVVCCRGTICSLIPAVSCTAPAGVGSAQFAGASCNGSGANTSPCCYADFDKNGSRTVDDIFIYINAWFTPAGNPFCKIGGNGSDAANIDDIFIFLNVWFAAGCG